MSSAQTIDQASGPRPPRLLPHLASARPTTSDAPRCPRCGATIALPPWAREGDLTECNGLLLRVGADDGGLQLDTL